MKRFLCMLALVTVAGTFVGNAQIQSGNVMVGGNIGNLDLGLNEGSRFTMTLSPKAAWFIKDNTAVGAYVSLSLTTAKGAGTDVSYGVGALGRLYWAGDAIAAVGNTRFFIEGNVGIEGENASKSSTNSSTNGLGLGFGPGIAYFITPNIGLEGLLMYKGIVGFGSRATTSNLNLNVGFQIYLPGRAVKKAVNMQ